MPFLTEYNILIAYDDKWFIESDSYGYNHNIARFLLNAELCAASWYSPNITYGIQTFFDSLGYTYTDNVVGLEDIYSTDSIVYADDNVITDADAVYLLMNIFYPEDYPIN